MGIEKEGNVEGKIKKKERSQYWCSRSPRELSLKSEPISPRTKRLGIPFAPVTKPNSIWPPPSPVYSPWSSPLSIAVLLPEMSIFETRARGGVNKHLPGDWDRKLYGWRPPPKETSGLFLKSHQQNTDINSKCLMHRLCGEGPGHQQAAVMDF